MIWFITIVLSLYTLINVYIVLRIRYFLLGVPVVSQVIFWLIIVFALLYPLGRILESFLPDAITKGVIHAGSFWLAFMTYLFLSLLLIDIITFLLKVSSIQILQNQKANAVFIFSLMIVILFTVIAGNFNANRIKIKHLDLNISKEQIPSQNIRIVLVSDIHLGTIIRTSFLRKIVRKINEQKGDIVLLAGDIVDEDVNKIIKQNMGQILQKIRARKGIFAITGNHEYISREVNKIERYLRDAQILMLRDSVAVVDDTFLLIGREDRASFTFQKYMRKPLSELMEGYNPNRYVTILMDHQPFHLEEAVKNKVDLQVSGHTHHGQLFPFNLITKMVYEKSWGYLKKGNTHFYISCGVGTWGPRVRIGSTPEIVVIDLHIKGEKKEKRDNIF